MSEGLDSEGRDAGLLFERPLTRVVLSGPGVGCRMGVLIARDHNDVIHAQDGCAAPRILSEKDAEHHVLATIVASHIRRSGRILPVARRLRRLRVVRTMFCTARTHSPPPL